MSTITNITFTSALEKLGMDDKLSSGIRFVADRMEEANPDLYLALEYANEFGAKAVYFRFYNDNRPPKPQIYIYDYSDFTSDSISGADIHHKLWNAGIVPFCFIFDKSQILVYNCAKKPEWDKQGEDFTTKPHDLISLLSEVNEKLNEYNVRQFDSGLFWDSNAGKDFKYEEGAYEQLLAQLKNVKANIISRVGSEKAALVKRVLMMLILIKYLEERKDEDDNGALNPTDFYGSYNPTNPTLEGVLESADIFIQILQELSSEEHFNGQIFYLSDEESKIIKEEIDLTLFQYFVRGDVSIFSKGKQGIGQMTLWRLYQFNYLPIELISHIYEDFLADEKGQKKKGVVYTPPYLVQFLIDQCMPLKDSKEDFKIIDPACGSGIFLVGAFKRMIQWWRLRNNWAKPKKENIEELKQLLINNIFGCDLENEAVTLSYFSLGLALLDALLPKEIWRNVHFDNLVGTNLFQGDFFKTLDDEILKTDFQLVIGNPPFNSEFTDWAETVNIKEKQNNPLRPDVPDNQIALLFLEQSFKLLQEGGNCCLILPSGPVLYNTNTHEFRKYLFEQYHFKGVFDFTPLRAKLFIGSSSSAKPAVVSVFAEKANSEKKPIYHYIFRRTKASSEKIEFEIDCYDIHKITHKTSTEKAGIWQANFMGGGRLNQLLNRISEQTTLGAFLDEMIENNGWKVAEGWIESPDAQPIKKIYSLLEKEQLTIEEKDELIKLQEKHKAKWITGFDYVETDSFTEDGIESISKCTKEYFYRSSKKNKEIFQPPHLLIKESVTGKSIPVMFSDKYLTFKDKIFGIHAPEAQSSELKKLENYLKEESCVSLMWLLSGQVLTSREGVPLKGDMLNLPYPKTHFDDIEKKLLSDIANYYSDFRKAGEKSIILESLQKKELESFGKIYCKILNSIYKNFKPLTPIVGSEFIVYPFVLGDEPEVEIPSSIENMESKLRTIINAKQGYNLWIKRIVKIYHKNVIFLYKPNQKRYWLPSIAVRDADETFVDLYKQGK
ncbi:class I SAM-dependent DNA methyltransferase [Chryseobacterium sp. CCH4-E10]|uniref:HsdM family class I SAM-dependent methyltransferase n=1 Tax=Chryseobacterium sp. CCH4-E10 TaxID=1768758 RepID=UPI00082AF431|nr:N-6 DNA methylase [Chryseobacterium sp. CCH4-E10]